MKELELDEIKEIECKLLCHFKEYCRINEIQYYLSNGTLLGAIKYKGFIPWDDDIDILVPRKDYDKLVGIYKDSEFYQLFSEERNHNYKYTFAKLCDMSTIKKEYNIDNGVTLGVDIDIFPLDTCTDHILKRHVMIKLKLFQVGCILSKVQNTDDKPLYKKVVIYLCKKLGYKYFSRKISSIVYAESQRGNTKMGCLTWPIYGEREIVSSELFNEKILVDFEGEVYNAPIGYDTYLRSLYGEYSQNPPLEKQKTHHSFKVYRR